jgi:hypothetical protein
VVADTSGGCDRNGTVITITVGCLLTVDPQSLRPRSLHLVALNGNVDIRVSQSIRGKEQRSDPDTLSVGEEAAKISVAGTSPVTVILTCGSCKVLIED